MSLHENTELLELASEHCSYWAGEGIGRKIELHIHMNDLEALQEDLIESAQLMWDLEYGSVEKDNRVTDETKEEIYHEN